MKQMMRWLQLTGISLLTILAVSGCKKVAPEEVTTQPQVTKVTTFAGSGGSIGGYLDGIGVRSVFSRPSALAMDASGNLYVADEFNFRIRKITPQGVVSTFAGNGINGYVDGQGTQAQLGYIEGITTDASGNIFISDYSNAVIRKITPAGLVSTYAGNGQTGLVNGPAATARFISPTGLGFDKAGNLFVADFSVIRKITADGIVSNYAGTPNQISNFPEPYNGAANNAVFGYVLYGLAVDPSGNVYVSDQSRNYIWKVTPAGIASTWAGDGTKSFVNYIPFYDGIGITAQFNDPAGLSCDADGNVFVADQSNHRIRKITKDNFVSTLAGNGEKESVDGAGDNVRIISPTGVLASSSGDVYFTETNKIRKIEGIVSSIIKPENNWNNPKSWGNP